MCSRGEELMAEFKEVLQDVRRMCDYYDGKSIICSHEGEKCPAYDLECNVSSPDFEKLEEIALQWAEEHPKQTNAEKFEEVFGIHLDYPERFNICNLVRCSHIGLCCKCECHNFGNRPYKEEK